MPYAHNGECELYYDSIGSPGDPTLLLVNGLGSQCINYATEWCEMFAAEGLHVVRFDNRDVGLSSRFADAPVNEHGAAYTLRDMAADAFAVLDAVGVQQAHIMGLSMGGMIVQTMAIEHDGHRAPRACAHDDQRDEPHRRARLLEEFPRGLRTAHCSPGHHPR